MNLVEQYKASFAKPVHDLNLTSVALRPNTLYIATEYPLLKPLGLNHIKGLIKFRKRFVLSSYEPVVNFMTQEYGYKFKYNFGKNYIYKVILKPNSVITNSQLNDYAFIHKNDIEEIKLIGSKFWFDENDIPDTHNYKLSSAVCDALKSYIMQYNRDLKDFKDFENFRVENEIKVYRGINIPYFVDLRSGHWQQKEIMNKFLGVKLFDTKLINFKKSTSWTTNFVIANDFAFRNDGYNIILSTKANKDNSIIDLRLLNKKLNNIDSIVEEEFEIILKPVPLQCKVIHLADKNGTLDVISSFIDEY